MKNKLDKNSKPSSGKSKESSSSFDHKAKDKTGSLAPKSKLQDASAAPKKSKPVPESKSEKPGKQVKVSSPAPAAKSNPSKTINGQHSKSPAKANRESPAPVSKHPAAGKTSARERGKTAGNVSAEDLGLEEFSISIIKPGETSERIWRTKNFKQHPAQRDFGFPDVAPELPGNYSEPRLVLMPKDPEYMFCYWELTPGLLGEREREKAPSAHYRETLKINWESKSLFELNFTFIPVFFWARKWYFGVPQVGQRYQVELGWLSDTGHFISIIRSNPSELPESWAVTQKRLAEQGEVLAFSSSHTKSLGSSGHLIVEDARAFAPEWNLSSESMSSSSWSRGVSQTSANPEAASTSAKLPKSRPGAPKARGGKTRLEISGKVLPGTQVFVGGGAVKVDVTGLFRTELPYNKDVLKLEIISRSGSSRAFTYDLKELVLN
ncbi:MAG: DUF4912 domain-containing protein [Fibrobacteria bacterium]